MKKLNIAVAGTGFGLSVHLPALIDSEKFIVNSIYNHNKYKKKDLEIRTGIVCHSNWKKIVSDKNIDGIVIATPPHVRFKLAKEALENNKHLLLEKPVALNSREIEELQRIALMRNLSVCVNFEYRVVPLFLQTKKILEENKLGKIYLIKLDWLMGSRSDPNREWNWYSEEKKGGGVLGALGTHAFDMLHWFFGVSNKVSANIFTSINGRPNLKNEILKVTSEDVCLSNIQISNHHNELIPCQVSLSSISRQGRGFSLEVYGSNGSLFLESKNQKDYIHGFTLRYINEKNKMININADEKFLFKKDWKDGRIAPVKRIQELWAQSIIQKSPVIPGLNEGRMSQRVLDSVKESAKSGFTVTI